MIGTTLARYTIEAKLGEGGMGVVFKARDPQLGRVVAIKVLPPDSVADPHRRRRFMQEAKAASALNHPHIITIYDIGTDGDTDFIVMEYLAGTTLDRLVPGHGLPPAQALAFAIAIADALAAAHAAGIIHRDLKPANVMVTDAGGLKVLDFGVAKLLEPEGSAATRTVSETVAGTAVGTPAYMSPEQAEARTIDHRSDVFSFGSVLYEMLTGQRAFRGQSQLSVLAKILNEEPTPPRQLTTAISPDMEKLILRCLRKDPARRYQTMADLKVALEDLADDVPRVAPPLSAADQRSSFSHWRWVVAALMAGVGIALFFNERTSLTPESNAPPQAVPMTSLPGEVRFPALSPDGDHIAFSWTGPTQDNNDIYVQQVGAGNPLRLTTDPSNDTNPVWSPDGRSIAFLRSHQGSARHELRLVPPLGGAERKIAEIEPRNPIYRPLTLAWCPDASCLIASDSQGEGEADALFTIALDSADKDKRQLTFPPAGVVIDTDAAVSPDGAWLVFRRDVTPATSDLYRLPLSSTFTPAAEPTRLTDNTFNASRPAWLPDSREIVVAASGSLWRLDAVAGGNPTRLPFVGHDGQSPTIARAGSNGAVRLVYRRVFSDSNVWRVDTTAAGRPASPPQRVIASTRTDNLPSLSPDGTRLAFFSGRSGEFELWVSNLDGSNAVQLTSLNAAPGFARWAPDSQTLAFHSDPEGHPDVLTVPAHGGRPRVLTTGPISGGYPSYSRDGRYLYLSGPDVTGQVRILKIPASGGDPVAVTQTTAVLPIESYDGANVFYVEAVQRPSALWRQPVAGGAPTKLIDGVVSGTFDVAENGIYYLRRTGGVSSVAGFDRQDGELQLQYFDFASARSTTVIRDLGPMALGLSVSRDGRTIYFSRIDSSADELMLVENFR